MTETSRRKSLSKNVSKLLIRRDMPQGDGVVVDTFPGKMTVNRNMFCLNMKNWIMSQGNGGRAVTI